MKTTKLITLLSTICLLTGCVAGKAETSAHTEPQAAQTSSTVTTSSADPNVEIKLDDILARMAQDDAERAKLSGNYVDAFGGKTKIEEISKNGESYQAKVVRTIAVTASEAEMEQARQTGVLVLNEKEYRYTDSREQLDKWLEGSPMQHNIPVEEDGIILANKWSGSTFDYEKDSGFYNVCKVGDAYIFVYSVGGFDTRLEKTANEDLIQLDGTMPLTEGPSQSDNSPEDGYTLASYLQNHSISSDTICRFEINDKNEPYIYVDIR